jgi:hypothetical protein
MIYHVSLLQLEQLSIPCHSCSDSDVEHCHYVLLVIVYVILNKIYGMYSDI